MPEEARGNRGSKDGEEIGISRGVVALHVALRVASCRGGVACGAVAWAKERLIELPFLVNGHPRELRQ